jgi:hypothetical protein
MSYVGVPCIVTGLQEYGSEGGHLGSHGIPLGSVVIPYGKSPYHDNTYLIKGDFARDAMPRDKWFVHVNCLSPAEDLKPEELI